ncbi:CoA pyrophosphatase [bacterium]|nr:CoA pyrophosphatase [bacterium]
MLNLLREIAGQIGHGRVLTQQLPHQFTQFAGRHLPRIRRWREENRPPPKTEFKVQPKIQKIPRPEHYRPGPPACWQDLADRSLLTKELIQQALAPVSQPDLNGHVKAAVLCALFEENGCLCVLLTRRAASLRSHTSEVSFPGGRLDPGEHPLQAALREAHEEIGLIPEQVEILGNLSPFSTRKLEVAILPFVGWLDRPPHLQPNPAEVEQVLRIPLARLWEEGVYHQEIWDLPEYKGLAIHFFELDQDIVWGATARVLHELLSRLWVPDFQAEPGP